MEKPSSILKAFVEWGNTVEEVFVHDSSVLLPGFMELNAVCAMQFVQWLRVLPKLGSIVLCIVTGRKTSSELEGAFKNVFSAWKSWYKM